MTAINAASLAHEILFRGMSAIRYDGTTIPLSQARRAAAALVLIALAFLLLRPVCELGMGSHAPFGHTSAAHVAAAQPDTGGDPGEICCASVKNGAVVKPADIAPLAGTGGALGVVLFLLTVLPRGLARGPAARRAFAAPPERSSYYARSARILR